MKGDEVDGHVALMGKWKYVQNFGRKPQKKR